MRAICSPNLLEAAEKSLFVAVLDWTFCIVAMSDAFTVVIPFIIFATLLRVVTGTPACSKVLYSKY